MKKVRIFLLTLIALFTFASLTACGEAVAYGPDYDFTNGKYKNLAIDEGVTIDGKFDEDFWQNKNWYEDEASDGSKDKENGSYRNNKPFTPTPVKITSHFTDKGVYYAASIDDKMLVAFNRKENKAFNAYWGTSIGFYVCRTGTEGSHIRYNALEIQVSASGLLSPKMHRNGSYSTYPLQDIEAGVNVRNGNVDKYGNGTMDGYDVELFIPWEYLNLDGKPEYLYSDFAIVRHYEATGKTTRGFERLVDGADGVITTNWELFNENGSAILPAPTNFTIDADLSDWADYSGKEYNVELYSIDENGNKTVEDTDPRYVRYGMKKGSDGLYIYTEALMRLYMNDDVSWFKNTNIEIKVLDKKGTVVTLYNTAAVDQTGAVVSKSKGVNSGVMLGQEELKLITMEYFISNFALKNLNLDVENDILVGYAFRNGKKQAATDELSLDTDEVVKIQSNGAGSSQPFIFYHQGTSPYGGYYHSVGEDGII